MKVIIKKKGKIKLRNPVLIEGLPGIANVSRIAVDFLIDKLGAKKYADIYSSCFPNSVIITDDSKLQLFQIEIYYVKRRGRDLVFLIGDAQPLSEEASYELSEEILKIASSLGVREVITLGGIGLTEESKSPRVHGIILDDRYKKVLSHLGVVFDGNTTVKIIIGMAGILLGLAGVRGFSGFSLLAETSQASNYIGVRAARSILKVLVNYFKLDISLRDIDHEIREAEKEVFDQIRLANETGTKSKKKGKSTYIG